MDCEQVVDEGVHSIAAAIGDPGRSRMLFCLMDNRARTATELAIVAGIRPSTASAHLARLKSKQLVKMVKQGKHTYYILNGAEVASVLEKLLVLSGISVAQFAPKTPHRLCAARTCYDHIAGSLGVKLHNHMLTKGWIVKASRPTRASDYVVTANGISFLHKVGIDVSSLEKLRRRLAYPCLDWSERTPHLGGSLGASILDLAKRKKWVVPEVDNRALNFAARGRRAMADVFGLNV